MIQTSQALLPVLVVFLISTLATGIKVAIIGGGIGGASSAYYLRKLAPPENELEIHLFNTGNIGGRMTTVRMGHDGKTRIFEAGATVIHPANLYFKRWLEEFNLHKKDTPDDKSLMGVWNGEEFVFMKSPWYLVTLYRLLTRYGFDPLRNRFEIRSLLADFENIYKLLGKGQSFDTIDMMAAAMSARLAKLLNVTTKEHLVEQGYHDPFIHEYAAAALNCNFGQSIEELHAFVGSVGLAGSGSGLLYSINGSNKLVVERLIAYSKAKVISAEVAAVSKHNEHFMLFDGTGQELGVNFDYVIVAAPLHQKQHMQIHGLDLEDQRSKYKQIVAVFVEGSIRASHWSLSGNDTLSTVFVCNNKLSYNSIGQISPVDFKKGEHFPTTGPNRVWKIFAKKEMARSELAVYFSEIRSVSEVTFLAYPDYNQPPSGSPRFRLAKGICYPNAVEWLASTMETSAVGGHNCANMLLKDLGLLKTDEPTKTEL